VFGDGCEQAGCMFAFQRLKEGRGWFAGGGDIKLLYRDGGRKAAVFTPGVPELDHSDSQTLRMTVFTSVIGEVSKALVGGWFWGGECNCCNFQGCQEVGWR
jgi:hypothetical protein